MENSNCWVTVKWYPEDVIDAAAREGCEISTAQAEEWLRENEKSFHELLVQAGNDVLAEMVSCIDWNCEEEEEDIE